MNITTFELHKFWRWKLLILFNCIVFLLFASYLIPHTYEFWKKIDKAFFLFINQPLKNSENLRIFWALANHRLADWFEDLCILGFYIIAIWKAQKGTRLRKGTEFLFCILLTALTILLMNRVVCRDLLHLRRTSPSLCLNEAVYLYDFLSWIEVKVYSSKSFPGDHATTALMFALSFAFLVRGRLAIFALFYGALLCLPRLAVGAHWLSDIVVGSGSIVLFSVSWVFFTPFANYCISRLEKRVPFFNPK